MVEETAGQASLVRPPGLHALSSPGRRADPRLHTHHMVLSHRHQGCPAHCLLPSFSLDNVHGLKFKVSGSSTSLICSLNDSVTFCNYFSLSNFSVPVLGSFLTVFTSLWRFAVCSSRRVHFPPCPEYTQNSCFEILSINTEVRSMLGQGISDY